MNIIMTFLQPPGPLGIKLSHCSKVRCSASSRGKSSSLIFIIIMFLAWRHFHHYITTVVIFRTITYKSFPSKYVRSCSFFSRFCFKNFVNRCLSQTPRFLSGIWLKFWNLEAIIWSESGVMWLIFICFEDFHIVNAFLLIRDMQMCMFLKYQSKEASNVEATCTQWGRCPCWAPAEALPLLLPPLPPY